MKNNTKRLLATLLALSMMLSMIGCGGTGKATDPSTVPTSEATVPTTEAPTEATTEPTEHVHEYEETVVEPNCTNDGYTEYLCSCGDSYQTDPTPKNGVHVYVDTVVEPTCTTGGYTEHKCSECGYSYKDTYTAAAHKYQDSITEPTCTTGGYTEHICTVCGYTCTDTYIPATHKFVDKVVNPTCTEGGYTEHTCSVCGYSCTDSHTPASHKFGDWVVTKEAQDHEDGSQERTCSVCGHVETEVIPKLIQEIAAWEVANAVLKYLNSYGAGLSYVQGLTNIAYTRASQLTYNFNHDMGALMDAATYHQYGEFKDMTEHGLDESYNYYEPNCREAIVKGGVSARTADEIGERLASSIYNSADHWSYVGSSAYPYGGVGAAKDPDGVWYACILVSDVNYDS